jgi:hypothetical protein
MSLSRKVKTAFDENRMLILGAQVLFGFQLQDGFQEGFAEFPSYVRSLNSLALVLMALTIGLCESVDWAHDYAIKFDGHRVQLRVPDGMREPP